MFVHSRFVEHPPIDLEVMNPSILRWFYHRFIKIAGSEMCGEQGVTSWNHRAQANVSRGQWSIPLVMKTSVDMYNLGIIFWSDH
jgi:hypothetical protein